MLITVILAVFIMAIVGCSLQNIVEVGDVNVPENSQPVAHSQIIDSFNNEIELNTAILKAREQVGEDVLSLADITEYYCPTILLDGFTVHRIRVSEFYISYHYSDENNNDAGSFTWFRMKDPETLMNGIYDVGAMSVRELEYDGIIYVFMEFADTETGESDGYEVRWNKDGKSFGASIPAGYSDEEVLSFCNFETVSVMESDTYTPSGGNRSRSRNNNIITFDPEDTPLSGADTNPDEVQLTHEPYIFGYLDNTFRPNNNATRAEFMAIMSRITGKPLVTTGSNFPDVPDSHWAANYIRTAKSNGWISGYPSGNFGPDDPITRAEAAAVLFQVFNPVDKGNKSFSDIAGHWARNSILAVASGGNLGGYPDGTFRPDNFITRAELVRMVNVMLNRASNVESVTSFKQHMTFTDVMESHWAYKEVLEAAVGHKGEYLNSVESWTDILKA